MPARNVMTPPPTTLSPPVSPPVSPPAFGLTQLHVDKSAAASLLDALQTARKEANGKEETLRFPGRGDRGAPLCFHGWNTYSNVAAEHDPAQQSKHTCVLYRGERGMLPRLSTVLSGFGYVIALANSAAPDMEIALVHVLFQDSPQARFKWHRDNEVEGSEDVERTIVILRSGHASAGTVKVALFLRPRCPRSAEGPDTTHARGRADSMSVGPDAEHGVASAEEESGIVTPCRTGEGFVMATGRQESCLIDAVVDGMRILDANADVSLVTMRRLAIPELGNERQASWKTAKEAMLIMQLPFELHEATALFRSSGAPMLNLLKAEPGVYIVGLDVGVRAAGVEKKYRHCICLTTIPTEHAPLGRLMDNSARTKPVYVEQTDLVHKGVAKKVWRKLLQQSIGHDDFSVNPMDVYHLRNAE